MDNRTASLWITSPITGTGYRGSDNRGSEFQEHRHSVPRTPALSAAHLFHDLYRTTTNTPMTHRGAPLEGSPAVDTDRRGQPRLSGPISVASKLPDGDGNGLGVIYGTLVRRPHKCHVVIAIVDCSKVTTNSDTGEVKPTARLRRIEVVTEDDLIIAEQLLSRAVDNRLGHEQLPFDLEADIHAAFKDAHIRDRDPS